MQEERWAPVPFEFFCDYYQISDHGRVRSAARMVARGIRPMRKKERILKPGLHTFGYPFVIMYVDKQKKLEKIHRMVAQVFVPNQLALKCVNHIDCNPANPHYTNLEWVSHKGNTQHAVKLGRFEPNRMAMAKLTWDKVDSIRKLHAETLMSQDELAKMFGVSRANISFILAGKTWIRPKVDTVDSAEPS